MRNLRSILLSVVMLPLAGVVAIPFYYLLVNTFKTQPEVSANPLALPSSPDFSNYAEVFATLPILQSLLNTLYVGAVSIALMLLVGSMAAYGMLIGRGLVTKLIGVVCLIAFLVPGQTTLIPLYRMLTGMHLVDTLEGLILLYLSGAIFCYFLIIGYMRTIPTEMFESARIDGASAFRIYWSIVLPLIRPILVTVGVFQAMWVWNDFITPNVFINSPEKQTLVLQVYSAVGQFSTDWPAFMTLSVIVLAPLVVFFLLAQRHIVSGLVAGSVKG
ncbi:carbohydrate ABC transporter permease [Glycomyces sp. MUSA5-2]|uniref:carbohydrate ABC transporter permease n=1 Tax=Glycomyces sp. MUSA5-2 TaxID=2053002 RepID=UPI00300B907F